MGMFFARDNFIWSCNGLSQERLVVLRGVGPDRISDLEWLTSHFGSRILDLGQFIHTASCC